MGVDEAAHLVAVDLGAEPGVGAREQSPRTAMDAGRIEIDTCPNGGGIVFGREQLVTVQLPHAVGKGRRIGKHHAQSTSKLTTLLHLFSIERRTRAPRRALAEFIDDLEQRATAGAVAPAPSREQGGAEQHPQRAGPAFRPT